MSNRNPGVNAVLLVVLFIALILCGPIILQGWRDLTRTADEARNFQP